MPMVLGVDSSARSTVVEVRDADSGALVARGRAAHPAPPGRDHEHDPSLWWTALVQAIEATGQRDIAAMSVAAQRQGLIVTDSAGSVLRPALLASDQRARGHAAALVTQLGSERWANAVGIVPDGATTIAKLAWLRTAEPAIFERLGHILLPHDWLTFRLTGRMVTDRGDASGTGYWSPKREDWRPDLLYRLSAAVTADDWRARLPRVLGPTELADWMTASVHEIVGLRGRPVIGAGTGRLMASALGVGLGVNEIALSLDPGGGVFTRSTKPAADPTGMIRGFADATGRYLPFAPVHDGVATTDAVARLMRADGAAMSRRGLHAEPGAGGVVVTPGTAHHGIAIDNLAADTTPEQLARAAFEGVVCAALDQVDAVTKAALRSASSEPLRLVGEAAASPAYRQILADLSGMPVVAATGEGAVVKGACVQAAAALAGVNPADIAAAWDLRAGTMAEPDESVDRAGVRDQFARGRTTTAQR